MNIESILKFECCNMWLGCPRMKLYGVFQNLPPIWMEKYWFLIIMYIINRPRLISFSFFMNFKIFTKSVEIMGNDIPNVSKIDFVWF